MTNHRRDRVEGVRNLWFGIEMRCCTANSFRQASLPQNEYRRSNDFKCSKSEKRNRRGPKGQHGNKPADTTEENHAPQRAKQNRLFFNRGNQAIQGNAQAAPDARKETEIAVEHRTVRETGGSIERIADSEHPEDARHNGNCSENGA